MITTAEDPDPPRRRRCLCAVPRRCSYSDIRILERLSLQRQLIAIVWHVEGCEEVRLDERAK